MAKILKALGKPFKKVWGFLKKKWVWIPALCLLVGGGGGYFAHKQYKKRKLARIKLDLSALAKVERGDMEKKFQEMGSIWPRSNIDVVSMVSGRVTRLYVHEGQTVKSGQPLAVIQPGRTGAERFRASTITAPSNGVLLRCVQEGQYNSSVQKFVELDDYVTGRFDNAANATCLASIADMSRLIVKLKINEVDILKLKEKMPVTIKVDAVPKETFKGTVIVIAKQAEEARGMSAGKVFRTEVAFQSTDQRLRIGMTARVSAIMEKRENVLKVSLSGLFDDEGRTIAYLHRENDKPKQVEFKPGFKTAMDVEVLEGLKEGQKIFTEKPVEFEALPPKSEDKPAKKGAPSKMKGAAAAVSAARAR